MSRIDAAKARFGKPVLLDLHPRRDRRHDERGRCSVCGRDSVFRFNSWVIPDDIFDSSEDSALSFAYERRDSLFCRSCCSSLRVRCIADSLLALHGEGTTSIAELVQQEAFRRLDVAEINKVGSMGSLHAFLAQLPRLSYSEYRNATALGEVIGGARNEDICRLTYDDESFDIVLSSDTLEHVSDFRAALRETKRVLRPGGVHIFTIPIVASRKTTFARAELGADGQLVHLLPPLFHGRGRGIYRYLPVGGDLLTFTEFGLDIIDHIREAGFEPEVLGVSEDHSGATWVFLGHVPGELR